MIKLYRHELSGHSHRVELFLNLLDLDFERIDVDLMAGAHKTDEFLALNPFGQVPVLSDGDTVVSDSNAILVYLSERYAPDSDWQGVTPAERAEIQRWLSVAAGEIASGPAAARLVTVFGAGLDQDRARATADAVLGQLDRALSARAWAAGENVTIADVALYAYVAHAPEGEVSLSPFPAVRAWINRIEQLPRFVPMKRTAVGLAA